jgi:hypothetical protein
MHAITFETSVAEDHRLHCVLPDSLPVGRPVRVTVELLPQDGLLERYEPRTEVGRKALAARHAYIAKGGRLMSLEEINCEVSRRRGGAENQPDE